MGVHFFSASERACRAACYVQAEATVTFLQEGLGVSRPPDCVQQIPRPVGSVEYRRVVDPCNDGYFQLCPFLGRGTKRCRFPPCSRASSVPTVHPVSSLVDRLHHYKHDRYPSHLITSALYFGRLKLMRFCNRCIFCVIMNLPHSPSSAA